MRAKFSLVLVSILLGGCATQRLDRPTTYLVFFDTNSASLSPAGYQEVSRAATTIRLENPSHVIIAGPKSVDAAGFETNLEDPRFLVVEQALISDGISHDLLSRAALNGVETAVGENGNRRIEIRLIKN
jgi:hypothetical protein